MLLMPGLYVITACSRLTLVATPERFARFFHGRRSYFAKMLFLALPFRRRAVHSGFYISSFLYSFSNLRSVSIYFGSKFPSVSKFTGSMRKKKRLVKKILSSIFKQGPHEEEVSNRRSSPDGLLFHNFRRLTLMRCCLAGNHSY